MMLSENEEKSIGRQIDECRTAIRKSICSYGMAAQFHIEKAERVLLGERSFLSDSINEGGDVSAEYLKTLPDLILQTSDCDAGCAELWLQKPQNQQTSEYLYQSDRLINLLSQFHFNDYFYEKLARISEKTMLVKAHNLLGSKDNKKRVYQLESQVRMMLDEFIKTEESIEANIQMIDLNRKSLAAAHEWLASEAAESCELDYGLAYEAAKEAISRAVQLYDYKKGYRFKSYAQWWVKQAIEDIAG